jgi:PPE-repeat protein
MQIERFNMLNFIGLLLFNATVLLFAATQPINASTISLDLKNYVYQATPNGKMLCQSDGQLCLFGYWNTLTEFQYVYSNGIHDYISRTTGPGNRMGVIRSAAGGVLR